MAEDIVHKEGDLPPDDQQNTTQQSIDIKHMIEKGAFAEVWLAELGRQKVALKMVFKVPRFAENSGAEHEYLLMEAADGPNIIKTLGFINHDAMPCIMMEYANGGDLHSFLSSHNHEFLTLVEVAHQMCEAVSWIHQRNIVHCDIKLENFLRNGNTILLTDFGLAGKDLDRRMGKPYGTTCYMPPELFGHFTITRRKHTITTGQDAWGLGIAYAVLFFLEIPWEMARESRDEKYKRFLSHGLPHIDQIPPALASIIQGLLTPMRQQRKSSADALKIFESGRIREQHELHRFRLSHTQPGGLIRMQYESEAAVPGVTPIDLGDQDTGSEVNSESDDPGSRTSIGMFFEDDGDNSNNNPQENYQSHFDKMVSRLSTSEGEPPEPLMTPKAEPPETETQARTDASAETSPTLTTTTAATPTTTSQHEPAAPVSASRATSGDSQVAPSSGDSQVASTKQVEQMGTIPAAAMSTSTSSLRAISPTGDQSSQPQQDSSREQKIKQRRSFDGTASYSSGSSPSLSSSPPNHLVRQPQQDSLGRRKRESPLRKCTSVQDLRELAKE